VLLNEGWRLKVNSGKQRVEILSCNDEIAMSLDYFGQYVMKDDSYFVIYIYVFGTAFGRS